MTDTVSTTTDEKPWKAAAALVPEVDWLVVPHYDRPCRVVGVHLYGTGPGWAMVVHENSAGHLEAQHYAVDDAVHIATAEQIAAAREFSERSRFLVGVHTFADWLADRPWAPVPYSLSAMVHLHDENGVDRVRQLAEDLDVKVQDHLDDRTVVKVQVGPIEYAVIAWHEDGRPDPTGLEHSRTDVDECEGAPASVPDGVDAIPVGSRDTTN